MTEPYERTTKVLRIFTTVGDVLLLQLCFAVVSLGVVTVVPAAISLQRSVENVLFQDESARIGTFLRQFATAFRRYWPLAVAVPVLTVMFVVAILFWASAADPIRLFALAVLIPLAGMFVGLYLAGLAASVTAPRDEPTSRELIGLGWARIQEQPLRVAGCVFTMLTWIYLLVNLPTLSLVGTGMVPALLAVWLGRGRRAAEKELAEKS